MPQKLILYDKSTNPLEKPFNWNRQDFNPWPLDLGNLTNIELQDSSQLKNNIKLNLLNNDISLVDQNDKKPDEINNFVTENYKIVDVKTSKFLLKKYKIKFFYY